MQGGWCAAIQAVRNGRRCRRRRCGYAECQAGVVGKRRYAEQSAAACVIGFAARAGVVMRHAAMVVMVNGPVRVGMKQALMLRRCAHCVQLIEAAERSWTGGSRKRSRRRQNAKSIGQCDQDCRPGPEVFRQITHRCLGTDFIEPNLYTISPIFPSLAGHRYGEIHNVCFWHIPHLA